MTSLPASTASASAAAISGPSGRGSGLLGPHIADADDSESSLRSLAVQTWVLSGRQLSVWFRDRTTMLQSLIVPVISMVMFKVVLGDVIGRATGQNSAYGTVPLVILLGSMFGSMAAGVRLNLEAGSGLLARLYVLPIHRVADLLARVWAELTRILLTTIMLLAGGYLIGFRLNQGVLPALGIVVIAMVYGIAFSTMVLALAVNSPPKAPLVPLLSLISTLLMFFNSGFAPADSYPSWMRVIVENQPMSPAIEVMRALAAGGPITENLIKTLVWAALLITIFIYPSIRGYQRAATRRG